MRPTRSRAAHLDVAYPRDAFAAMVEQLLALVNSRAELAGQYALVCLFWGFIVYCAVAFAIQ